MPRQKRLVVPGIAQHVVQRGNNRHACFFKESDYVLYLLHLRELSQKYYCAIHAYCLMTNHVHLLLTPGSPDGLSSLMRDLGQRYVQYVNRVHCRSGTLWEGRFRSCVAESARYVMACHRYIELNPVRANMVRRPEEYQWSSHLANSVGEDDRLVTPHPEFLALGNDKAARSRAYCDLFSEPVESTLIDAIREATNGGYPLASASFMSSDLLPPGRKMVRGRAGRRPDKNESMNDDSLEIGL